MYKTNYSYLSVMFLYNVTIVAEAEVGLSMRKTLMELLPKLQQSTGNKTIAVLKITDPQHEGETYCVQYSANSLEDLSQFQDGPLQEMQQLLDIKYKGKVYYFASLMEYINQ